MLLLTLRETYASNRLSSFKNLRRKGGKFDYRPGRPKVLLRHCQDQNKHRDLWFQDRHRHQDVERRVSSRHFDTNTDKVLKTQSLQFCVFVKTAQGGAATSDRERSTRAGEACTSDRQPVNANQDSYSCQRERRLTALHLTHLTAYFSWQQLTQTGAPWYGMNELVPIEFLQFVQRKQSSCHCRDSYRYFFAPFNAQTQPVIRPKMFVSGNMAKNRVGRSDFLVCRRSCPDHLSTKITKRVKVK